MGFRIAVLPGDGIGPEVVREAVRILRAVSEVNGYGFEFREYAIGGAAIRESGGPLPAATLQACQDSDAVLLGAVGAPDFDALPPECRPEAGLLELRRRLGGFANLRPATALAPVADCSPLRPEIVQGADVLFVRELLGGIYFGQPRGRDAGAALNTLRYSAAEVERIARVAFEQARRRRRKVTSVDKANVLETSQLWREEVTRVAADYRDVRLEHLYVDACAMRLLLAPGSFDVILTENLFGDILSDEAAAIAGSMGLLPSATLGGAVNLYEPVHGSAPDIAGKDIANPVGAILSAALLLRYSAELEADARAIELAVHDALKAGYRTADLLRPGHTYTIKTSEMGQVVEYALHEVLERQHAYHAV